MQDLRLIGVHEDGMHLVLADEAGTRYNLPIDDALRSAARRDHLRPGQLPLDLDATLRPKDVQAMIRAGLTAEEVAERAGWSVEKVHRYEVPILAEREHIAGLARDVRLRGRAGAHGAAPTLGERVAERLRSREIDAPMATWDSRRAERGSWTVLLNFEAGGRRRQAIWDFDPLARTVVARDDEARWLSEDEAVDLPGPIPAPHLRGPHRPTRLYDVEAEGGLESPSPSPDETLDLMAAMRERSAQRGRRRRAKASEVPGLDRAPVEALPLAELAQDPAGAGPPPAAHPHPGEEAGPDPSSPGPEPPDDSADEDAADELGRPETTWDDGARDERYAGDDDASRHAARTATSAQRPSQRASGDPGRRPANRTTSGPPSRPDDEPEDLLGDERTSGHPLAAPNRRTGTDALPSSGRRPPQGPEGGSRPTQPAPKPKPPSRKSGRPSVPAWDDIVFGRKPD